MSGYIENLDKMFEVWNTTDTAHQDKCVGEAMEHNLHFVDPRHNIIGHKAFLDMVRATQKEIPNAVYARSSEVGFQNNFCRYHWTIHLNGECVMTGFDTVEVTSSGTILKVIGFFGEIEKL